LHNIGVIKNYVNDWNSSMDKYIFLLEIKFSDCQLFSSGCDFYT
jgi:hypothetical protein